MTDTPNPEEEKGINEKEEGEEGPQFPADVNTDLDPSNGEIADDSLEEYEEDADLPDEEEERKRHERS